MVLADVCGKAALAASGEDWLIPSGMLGGIVSGLISRTILSPQRKEGQFHGCKIWTHLVDHDITQHFVDSIWKMICTENLLIKAQRAYWTAENRKMQQNATTITIHNIAELYGIKNINLIKPGIAEATRAVLRRVPYKVLVTSLDNPNLKALLHLCSNAGINVEVVGEALLPYNAVTLIKKVEQ